MTGDAAESAAGPAAGHAPYSSSDTPPSSSAGSPRGTPPDSPPDSPPDQADLPRLQRLLGGPDLAWLLARVRRRIAEGRDPATGSVTLNRPTPGERTAVARLLGRPARHTASVSVPLEAVDRLLRDTGAHPGGLGPAVAALTGPVRDRAADAAETDAAWQRAWQPLEHAVADAACSGLGAWLEQTRATGLLRRITGTDGSEWQRARAAETLSADAAAVLRELTGTTAATHRVPSRPPTADRPVSLAAFAARVLGNPHALDDDRALTTLVLGAVRALSGAPTGTGTQWRRDTWAAVGLVLDELSSTVLTLGLAGDPDSPGGRAVSAWYRAHEPVVLTLRQLSRVPRVHGWAAGVVYVCENPAVVAAAADLADVRSHPLVCLRGQPSAAAVLLLRRLAEAGAELRYHGDFDHGGIRIANALARHVAWTPWHFDAASYRTAASAGLGRELIGGLVVPSWDPDLGEAMAEWGRAIDEESVLDTLLTDL
ncbi:TIGR02679 family protein [Streptomycetaceae bacterium NBC_01309]